MKEIGLYIFKIKDQLPNTVALQSSCVLVRMNFYIMMFNMKSFILLLLPWLLITCVQLHKQVSFANTCWLRSKSRLHPNYFIYTVMIVLGFSSHSNSSWDSLENWLLQFRSGELLGDYHAPSMLCSLYSRCGLGVIRIVL